MIQFDIENGKITEDELVAFEQKLEGLQLPEDYKQHMLLYNGGDIVGDYVWETPNGEIKFYNFHPIKYGSNTMEEGVLIDRIDVLPETDIYIGRVLGGELCMSLGENYGAIYVYYSDGERVDLASSFTEFINGLVPFEEDY